MLSNRFLFFFFSLQVLAINIYWSFFSVLLPFSIGRVVLFLLRCFPHGWIAENASEVAAGDMVMSSVFLAYLGSVFSTLPRNTYLTRVRWFLPSVKDAFILCFKLAVLPWILGCWLDFCTSPILGKTFSQSVEVLSDYPLLAAKHWDMGMLYLVVALSCMKLIQKVTFEFLFHPHASSDLLTFSSSFWQILQKRAFWYLLDVAEPNYKITKLHLGPILLAFALHGVMVVIVLYLPVKTISLISQSFFPLQFG